MQRTLTAYLQRIRLKMPQVLGISALLLGLYSILLLGLCWLCREVWEKESFRFDRRFLLTIHSWSNPTLDTLMLGVTHLGDPECVVTVIIATFVWLGLKRRYRDIVMFTIACLGTFVLNAGLKVFFSRPRPTLWSHLIVETTFSFPSGHAIGSMVLYGMLAYFLARQFPGRSRLIYGLAAGLILSIGWSRLYLGVHWPTDILAGYSMGFLWLMTCITLFRLPAKKSV